MKRFFAFVRKEFKHIFRDYRTLIILFGVPAIQIIIFGYVVSMDIRDANVAVLDHARDPVSRELIEKIDGSEFFKVASRLNSPDEIDPILQSGRVKQVIVFEPNLEKHLMQTGAGSVQLITDASDPNTGQLVNLYTEAIIADFAGELNNQSPAPITTAVRMYYNPTLESEYMFVPGLITLVLMLICALMTSVTITREKEFGTMEVLLASPLRPIQIILGKVAPYISLGFADVLIILGMANVVFGLPVKGSLALLLAESILYILLALSLGILISTISKTMQQAMFISAVGLLLPSVLLSGFIFPIENMPVFYHYFSAILPPRWFVIIIKNIMLKGTGLAAVWKETLILVAMTVFFITLSVRKFKIRLE